MITSRVLALASLGTAALVASACAIHFPEKSYPVGDTGGAKSASASTGSPADGGTGGTAPTCIPSDCAAQLLAASPVPAGCAEASCDTTTAACLFQAVDADGDGHRTAVCSATGVTVVLGDDCDDTDPTTYPGAWNGPACDGNPDRCDGKDHACNGMPASGKCADGQTCTCTPWTGTGTCDPSVNAGQCQVCGTCMKGLQTCGAQGTWGACTGDPPVTASCSNGPGLCNDGMSMCGGACMGGTTNYGTGCGSCNGTVVCGGACSEQTPSSWGQSCNDGCGTIQCDSTCSHSQLTATSCSKTCTYCDNQAVCNNQVCTPYSYRADSALSEGCTTYDQCAGDGCSWGGPEIVHGMSSCGPFAVPQPTAETEMCGCCTGGCDDDNISIAVCNSSEHVINGSCSCTVTNGTCTITGYTTTNVVYNIHLNNYHTGIVTFTGCECEWNP